MIKNYFIITWRNLKKNKFFSSLNILGLAAGMAVALLIGLWVYHEYSYDKFLPDYKQLYRVKRNYDNNGDTLTFSTVSLKLADELRRQVPEIEYVVESDWMGQHGLMVGDKKIYIRGGQVGMDFLKAFQYPMLYGNATTVFNDAYSIVLTESTARSLFGKEDPIGKMVRYDNNNDLKVTGVLKDLPSNSTFKFEFLVPFSYLEQTNANVKANRAGGFGQNAYQEFVKLKDGADLGLVSGKIRNIEHTETNNTNATKSYVFLQPLEKWHLYSDYKNGVEKEGFIEYVRMFSIIGFLVLLIACINFINITTARSSKRAREVGVRKAIGSGRRSLIFQFLAESFIFTLVAFILSVVLVQLVLPAFNTLTHNEITIPYSNPVFWMIMLGAVVATALIAGSSPAFYLSSFKPVKVLKGVVQPGKTASLPRKALVVVQFTCSVALIISTIIIYQQIDHAKSRPTGYDVNRVMMNYMSADLKKNYEALSSEMVQKGIVENVVMSSSPATDIYWHSGVDKWPGMNSGETIEMATILTRGDYFGTLGMTLQQGRDFTSNDDSTSVIFNAMAIKMMRIKDPLQQTITWGGTEYKIAGVVNDALMANPYTAAEPTMFLRSEGGLGSMMYRLSSRISTQDALAQLTSLFNKYNPTFPYNYRFADATYAEKFQQEVLIGKLAGIFAALAVLISCLGLFGLAVYMAEQRTKEIGIRKVLGATVSQVWLLLSKDFIILVIISCLIASPIAFYFLHEWLQKYDYRITIGPAVFLLAALSAIAITILTISFQAIKAAIANPVKSLRTE
jgi:ABC-type antimicrobial peptide transport system permease subunit